MDPLSSFYSVAHTNVDFDKNMLLLKNPQFLPDHYETLSKLGTHEYLIVSKFRDDWVKIVDFLIKGHFWSSPHWAAQVCTSQSIKVVIVVAY